jgi:hypothetical protein
VELGELLQDVQRLLLVQICSVLFRLFDLYFFHHSFFFSELKLYGVGVIIFIRAINSESKEFCISFVLVSVCRDENCDWL